MRWQSGRQSTNVQDRRGARIMGGGIGAIVVTVIALLMGVNPADLIQSGSSEPAGEMAAPADEMGRFVASVLGDTEDVWTAVLGEAGREYPEPQLILFTGAAQSACGFAQSAMGPFYCPRDESVYIDLSFYDDLRNRFAAPGDFAQAYVIAHEVGHHVQNVLGLMGNAAGASGASGGGGANAQSVRIELQADCFAGIWAHHAQRQRDILEPGDIEEALGAAAAIGDDRIQRRSQGYVVPESFTHGTSEQRVQWFRTGFEHGSMQRCNPG